MNFAVSFIGNAQPKVVRMHNERLKVGIFAFIFKSFKSGEMVEIVCVFMCVVFSIVVIL